MYDRINFLCFHIVYIFILLYIIQVHADDDFVGKDEGSSTDISEDDMKLLRDSCIKIAEGELIVHTKCVNYFLSHHVFNRRISPERYCTVLLLQFLILQFLILI